MNNKQGVKHWINKTIKGLWSSRKGKLIIIDQDFLQNSTMYVLSQFLTYLLDYIFSAFSPMIGKYKEKNEIKSTQVS